MLLHSHSLYSSHSNGAQNGKCNPLVVKDAKDKEKSKKQKKKQIKQFQCCKLANDLFYLPHYKQLHSRRRRLA